MVSELPPAYCSLNESNMKHKVADKVVMINDLGEELVVVCSFEDKNTRIAFTQKALSIILLQQLAVSKIMFCFNRSSWLRSSMIHNYNNYLACSAMVYFITLCLMVYCKEARKKTPYIYMFLVLYPVTLGCLINILAHGFFIFEGIYIAVGFFCNVLLALLIYSVFALHHKIEFTIKAGIYITVVLLIGSFATTIPFIYMENPFGVLYPSLVVFLLSSYILTDLQAMVSKSHRLEFTPADFLMGALMLQIDYRYIITKFLRSLETFSTTIPFIYMENPFGVLYPSLVVFLLSSYILTDLQAMVSKSHRLEFTPADFLMGALMLQIDYRYIITKFLRSLETFCK